MTSERAACLVVGSGNALAGDDAAGIVLLDRLAQNPRPGWRYVVAPRSGLAILDLFDHAETIVFLDAVVSGSVPGTIHIIDLPSTALLGRGTMSSHGWGILEALELAAILGRDVPRLILVGIEVSSTRLGDGLSEPVARAIDACAGRFQQILADAQGH